MRVNYPEKALGWITDARWIGPVNIPLDRVDFEDSPSWAAAHESGRVKHFAKEIKHGRSHLHPVVAVQEPGDPKIKVIDGHHRALAYRKLGKPVKAYVGFVTADGGPWDETHSSQVHHGGDPANKCCVGAFGDSLAKGASGYSLNARSGMISLDLPEGAIEPVPGGVDDHHITVVYLGPDVDDDAYAHACGRARDAAAEGIGPTRRDALRHRQFRAIGWQ